MNENDGRAIKDFHDRIVRLLGDHLVRTALFGSKAEGYDTPESDIDILVLIHDAASPKRDQILDEAFEVNVQYGVYISPRIITMSIYNHPVWRMTPFLRGLREKAVVL